MRLVSFAAKHSLANRTLSVLVKRKSVKRLTHESGNKATEHSLFLICFDRGLVDEFEKL